MEPQVTSVTPSILGRKSGIGHRAVNKGRRQGHDSRMTTTHPPLGPAGGKRARKPTEARKALTETTTKTKKASTPTPPPQLVACSTSPATPSSPPPVRSTVVATTEAHDNQVGGSGLEEEAK